MPVLEIPRNKKKYTWSAEKNRYIREKLGHYPGDEGLEINDRVYSYHPTKGWRSRSFTSSRKDYTNAPGLIQFVQHMFRQKGLA